MFLKAIIERESQSSRISNSLLLDNYFSKSKERETNNEEKNEM